MAKLKRRPPNNYAFATAMISSVTALFLGYDLAMVSSTAVFVEADLKLLACIVVLSSLLGALTTVGTQGLIGDRYTVLLSAAVLCVAALVRGLATNFAVFMVGIFINGIGMGQALMIVPVYITDVTPSSSGGLLSSHPDGFVYLGCILGSICYSTGFVKLPVHLAWRLTLAFGTAIPISLGIAILFMPESPRWLATKDQLSKARRVLARTSATLEEAELRMIDIKAELGIRQDSSEEVVPVPTHRRWREEYRIWRELLTRPTEPFHRALISALVAKVFQQASGIGSMLQYAQKMFHKVGISSDSQIPSALVAFGCTILLSFAISLLFVELIWLLVLVLADSCQGWPSHSSSCRDSGYKAMTRRQERLKWARGLSATMLFSLMALVWIVLGPVRWKDTSRNCPLWLRTSAMAMNRAVSAAIFSSFAWLYKAIAIYGNLFMYAAIAVLGWWFFGIYLRDKMQRYLELMALLERSFIRSGSER